MAFKFNSLTGNFDLTNSDASSTALSVSYDNTGSGLIATNVQDAIDELAGSSPINFASTFNATTDWTLDTGIYKIDIGEGTHLKGTNPMVEIFESSAGPLYTHLNTDIVVDNSGQVTIKVNQTPDLRFAGRVVIS